MTKQSDYNLLGVRYFEIELEVTRTEKIVFAVDDERAADTTDLSAFVSTLGHHMFKSLHTHENPRIINMRFREHLDGCTGDDCDCATRLFEQCDKESLNTRRLRKKRLGS